MQQGHHTNLEGLGQEFFAGRGQHGHELLERLERRAQLELDAHVTEVLDVRQVGGVVVRVEPAPRRYAIEVVVQDPLYRANVTVRLFMQHGPEESIVDSSSSQLSLQSIVLNLYIRVYGDESQSITKCTDITEWISRHVLTR